MIYHGSPPGAFPLTQRKNTSENYISKLKTYFDRDEKAIVVKKKHKNWRWNFLKRKSEKQAEINNTVMVGTKLSVSVPITISSTHYHSTSDGSVTTTQSIIQQAVILPPMQIYGFMFLATLLLLVIAFALLQVHRTISIIELEMNKVLVANRGEIAIRIITAASELGIKTIAVYSDEQDKTHCKDADEIINLKIRRIFLDPQQIIDTAKSVKTTAIHPGYGFLSESTELAERCKQENILFIGPSASCISAVGDKVTARQVTNKQVFLLKARDGGGGRGIRMIHEANEVLNSLLRCMNESPSKQIFVMRKQSSMLNTLKFRFWVIYTIVLLEEDIRKCSTMSLFITSANRSSLHQAAVKLSRTIRYNSADTVEFLVLPESNEFYCLEVNPRIQVEHIISKQITRVCIVQAQEKIVNSRLVSIQPRVVAENPLNNNMLSASRINKVEFPQEHGIRVDTWIQPGCVILPTFDSLTAKIIVIGQPYEDALSKLKCALKNTIIHGVKTNIRLLIAILQDNSFMDDQLFHVRTDSVEKNMSKFIEAFTQLKKKQENSRESAGYQNAEIPSLEGAPSAIQFKPGDTFNVELSEILHPLIPIKSILFIYKIHFHKQFSGPACRTYPNLLCIPTIKNPLAIAITRKFAIGSSATLRRKANPQVATEISSPITGLIVKINIKEGDRVGPGQQLFVISAMKMEIVVQSSLSGIARLVYASASDLIEGGNIVIELSSNNDIIKISGNQIFDSGIILFHIVIWRVKIKSNNNSR
ncbi:hypothetical protein BD770DRAFT_411596 [Pilaira anomala]|nr:hypothetical protein BD770DRAFT_411596 [Pilaira anomala]